MSESTVRPPAGIPAKAHYLDCHVYLGGGCTCGLFAELRAAEVPASPEAGQPAPERWHYTAGSQHVGCICCCVDGKHAARFHATADDLNDYFALEARAEADGYLRSLLAVIHRDGGHYALEHGLNKATKDAQDMVLADRQKIAELEARLVRCGGENCMGFDASEPNWPVARWVREERLQAAEAEVTALRGRAAYVQHLPDCDHLFNRSMTCSCGLDGLTTPAASQPTEGA